MRMNLKEIEKYPFLSSAVAMVLCQTSPTVKTDCCHLVTANHIRQILSTSKFGSAPALSKVRNAATRTSVGLRSSSNERLRRLEARI